MRIAQKIIICTILLSLTISAKVHAKQSEVKTDTARSGAIVVFTTIAPHAFFARRIGGGHVVVKTLIPPGASPHSFEPTPKQMAELAKATAYFKSGVEAEKSIVPKISSLNRHIRFFDVNAGIALLEDGHDHHGGHDPHVWLSPPLAKLEAKNIFDGLAGVDPGNENHYRKNLNTLISDLDALNSRIAARFKPLKGRSMFVFHPAFGYFANTYGVEQVAIAEEGKEPGAKRLAALIDMAKKDGAKVMFVEPQFSEKAAQAIASAIGGTIVKIDPLAANYIANMESMASIIAKALEMEADK